MIQTQKQSLEAILQVFQIELQQFIMKCLLHLNYFHIMDRISPQNLRPRFSHNHDLLYREIKARQLQYINLITELHEENHRLRNLVSDQEKQIKKLTQNLPQPHRDLNPQKQFIYDTQNIPFKASPINSFSQPISLKRIQMPRSQSPNMNPTILCHIKSTRFQTLNQKENEQDLPSVKPEEIFKQALRKRKQCASDDLAKKQNSMEKKKVTSNLEQTLNDVKQQEILKEDSILQQKHNTKVSSIESFSMNKPQTIKVKEFSLLKNQYDFSRKTHEKMRSKSPKPAISNKVYL